MPKIHIVAVFPSLYRYSKYASYQRSTHICLSYPGHVPNTKQVYLLCFHYPINTAWPFYVGLPNCPFSSFVHIRPKYFMFQTPVSMCWNLCFGLDDQPPVGRDFSLRWNVRASSGVHTASYPVCTLVILSGVKRPGREANHLPSYSVGVRNEWSCTFAGPYTEWPKAIRKKYAQFSVNWLGPASVSPWRAACKHRTQLRIYLLFDILERKLFPK
jgi:hypothetical protein